MLQFSKRTLIILLIAALALIAAVVSAKNDGLTMEPEIEPDYIDENEPDEEYEPETVPEYEPEPVRTPEPEQAKEPEPAPEPKAKTKTVNLTAVNDD